MTTPTESAKHESGGWVYAGSLLTVGAAVIAMALRNLSLEDPRWTHNAWTYIAGVPIGLLLITIVSQAFASHWVERTLQAAFLISLAVHLLLLSEAYHLIVLGRSVRQPDQGQQTAEKETKTEQNYSSVSYQPKFDQASNQSIASAITRSEMADSQELDTSLDNSLQPSAMPETELQLLQKELQHDPQSIVETEMQRQVAPADEVEITSRAAELNKQAVDASQADLSNSREPVAVPEPIDAPDSTLPEPIAPAARMFSDAPSDASRDTSPVVSSPPLGPSGFEPSIRPRNTALPMTNVRESDTRTVQNEIQGTLELQLRQRARAFRLMPRSDSIGTALSPSDLVLGNPSAAVPNSDSGELTDRLPSTEVAGLGVDRSLPWANSSRGSQTSLNREGSAMAASSPASQSEGTTAGLSAQALLGPRSTDIRPREFSGSPSSASLNSSGDRLPSQIGQNRSLPLSRASTNTLNPIATAVPTAAFARRADRNNQQSQEADLGQWGPQTEAAIEAGLKFLATHQRADGRWSLGDFGDRPMFESDTAATALSLLSFQGAGYSHLQYQYQDQCKRALDFLIQNQAPDGDLYIPMNELSDRNSRFYSHGIAALALCEAYGMTQDESLREPAQRSIDFLLATQDPLRGGWRYTPKTESDTSVTGWCMMAMKSAELAGLKVDATSYESIGKYLNNAQASPQVAHLYRYNFAAADLPQTRHGLSPTPTMTSVGLLLRLYLGWKRDNSNMVQGANYLLESIPEMGTVQEPKRDTYYWYYATQVMFHMGGEYWKRWNMALHPMLIQTQLQRGPYAGSWDAGGAIPDRWGSFAGRLYVTTLNLLSLEVYYRHLPIYEETGK